jgi:hypothetical protein
MPQQIVKLFRGAKVADIPIEQPTKFELVINLKTAKCNGCDGLPGIIAASGQADRVTPVTSDPWGPRRGFGIRANERPIFGNRVTPTTAEASGPGVSGRPVHHIIVEPNNLVRALCSDHY